MLECVVLKETKPSQSEIPEDKETSPIEEKKEISESKAQENKIEEKSEKSSKKVHPQLNENFVFETFIPGDNSMFAYNAAVAVAKEPGKSKNPILFYGGSGLGKTHLMQAIGNYIYNNNPDLKICYIQAESFTNEFLESLKLKKTNEFKTHEFLNFI